MVNRIGVKRIGESQPVRTGFTLVELLVVIAIIGVLVALLLPAVQAAREAARRSSCGNNLKQISLGIHNYHDTYLGFPAGNVTNGNCCGTAARISWAIDILPFIEQKNLYDRYDKSQPDTHANNRFVVQSEVKTYNCPSDPNIRVGLVQPGSGPGSGIQYRVSSYRAVSGFSGFTGRVFWDTCEPGLINALPAPFTGRLPHEWKGVLHSVGVPGTPCSHGEPERFATIVDGTSNTLLVGEYYNSDLIRRTSFWAYGYASFNSSSISDQSRTLNFSYNKCNAGGTIGGDNPCKRGFGAAHPGVIQFALADASVRPISVNVDTRILGGMATIQGGEAIQLP
jgi:prepilin-type N-terminal cleavage/methylation domain-containing protein